MTADGAEQAARSLQHPSETKNKEISLNFSLRDETNYLTDELAQAMSQQLKVQELRLNDTVEISLKTNVLLFANVKKSCS